MTEATMERRVIDPATARTWIDSQKLNRKLSSSVVDAYARDMAAGKWRFTGDAIKFNDDGALVDGQHRLHACVRAGVSFDAIVVAGVEENAQWVLDSGKPRTFSDQLKLAGEANYKHLASTVRAHWNWQNNGTPRNDSHTKPTIPELFDWLNQHPDMRAAVTMSNRLRERPIAVPTSMAGAFCYEAMQRDSATAKQFVEDVATGEGLLAEDPAFVLREWFINRTALSPGKVKPATITCLAVTIKAWNAYLQGTPMRTLKWARVGKNREKFPEMLGPEDVA